MIRYKYQPYYTVKIEALRNELQKVQTRTGILKHGSLSRWLQGMTRPCTPNASMLSEKLRVPFDQIFEAEARDFPDDNKPDGEEFVPYFYLATKQNTLSDIMEGL